MKPSPYTLLLLLLALLIQAACAASSQPPSQKVQRLPLQRSEVVLKSPAQYEKRALSYDSQTGLPSKSYDHKPRIEVVDEKAGKYAFKWIGFDGEEKVIEYQRADAIDVVVSASVTKTPEGQYLYSYKVYNLPSNAVQLSSFAVQNFAPDAKPVEVDGKATNISDLRLLNTFREAPSDGKPRNFENLHIGQMSNDIQQFKDGNWIRIAPLPKFSPQVVPGRGLDVKLVSAAPPGLVGCRITGGDLSLEGVGEEIPGELDALIPGYEEWPRGYTIGPRDNLKVLSATEYAKYLLDLLPQMQKLGWITDQARRWYAQNLPRSDFDAVLRRAERDLKSEQITSEVFAMIQAINFH